MYILHGEVPQDKYTPPDMGSLDTYPMSGAWFIAVLFVLHCHLERSYYLQTIVRTSK